MPENKEQKATPITAETKKSTEPTKAEESKSPTGQKAKTTQEVTKPTGEAKPAPATEAKKPLEAPKPAPSTQAPTPPVDQKKVTKAPKSPGDAKAPAAAEAKKPMEPAKAEEVKSPAGQKAKATQETSKPTVEPKTVSGGESKKSPEPSKAAPATEAKKPSEAPKPAPSTQAPTPPVDQKKVTEAPKSPGDAKAPVTAEAKKPTEPAKTEEAKSPAGQKAKTTQEVTKPTRESKAAPAAEPKKPSEAPKPAPSTQATTRLVDQQKPPEVPKSPGDAKTPAAAEAKKPAETPKLPSDAKAPVIPAVPDTAKQTLPKGMRITQVIADRLDKPDEKALKDLPVPKEGEGISARLHPDYFFEFLDHPFSINREVADYKDLFDSIKANGINEPVKARPREGGGLELLSGHRRHDVAKQLGYPVPVVIVQMDDDSARIEVVDGNLHRQDIPTSELARAAKMKMEALARKAGRRSKMDQLTGPSKRTDQIVAEDMGMSRNQVNRLVRIDSLVPELKQQVDEKKLPFNTAVELSFLKPEEQGKVVDFIKKEQMVPSLVQATQLKEASRAAQAAEKEAEKAASKASPSTPPSTEVKAQDKAEKKAPAPAPAPVDEKKIAAIVKPKTEPEQKYTFTSTELREYFPGDRLPSVSEVKRKVFDALDLHKRALERKQAKEALKESMKKGPER